MPLLQRIPRHTISKSSLSSGRSSTARPDSFSPLTSSTSNSSITVLVTEPSMVLLFTQTITNIPTSVPGSTAITEVPTVSAIIQTADSSTQRSRIPKRQRSRRRRSTTASLPRATVPILMSAVTRRTRYSSCHTVRQKTVRMGLIPLKEESAKLQTMHLQGATLWNITGCVLRAMSATIARGTSTTMATSAATTMTASATTSVSTTARKGFVRLSE